MHFNGESILAHLLRPFCSGPGKTIVIVDSTGTEEVLQFGSRKGFELWSRLNILKEVQQDGKKRVVDTWEDVQDGGRYYTDRTLDKIVGIIKRVPNVDIHVACMHTFCWLLAPTLFVLCGRSVTWRVPDPPGGLMRTIEVVLFGTLARSCAELCVGMSAPARNDELVCAPYVVCLQEQDKL